MEEIYIQCTKCHKKIKLDEKAYNSYGEQKVECSSCGAKILVKKTITKKEIAKKIGFGIFKRAKAICEFGCGILVNEAEKYQNSSDKLYSKGMEEWDEDTLREESNNAFRSQYDKAIIRDELKKRNKE